MYCVRQMTVSQSSHTIFISIDFIITNVNFACYLIIANVEFSMWIVGYYEAESAALRSMSSRFKANVDALTHHEYTHL